MLVTRACVVQSSTLLFAVGIVVALITAIRAPLTRNDANNSFFWRLAPYRDILEQPPFFFKEVRLALLSISLLYCIGRLIYEAIIGDVFVVLMVARLCMTLYMLGDQWWLCRNWKPFFVEHTLRPWLWQRLFVACAANSFMASLDVINDFEWVYCASRILAGLAVMYWYMWGKRWDWRRNDMDDNRRLTALTFAATSSSAIYLARLVYDLVTKNDLWRSSVTAMVMYGLLGLTMIVVKRRQRRLMVTINHRRSSMETLERSMKNVSNRSTPRAAQSPRTPRTPRGRLDQVVCGTTVADENDNDNDGADVVAGTGTGTVDNGSSATSTANVNGGFGGDSRVDVTIDRTATSTANVNGGFGGDPRVDVTNDRTDDVVDSTTSDGLDPELPVVHNIEDGEEPVGTPSRSNSMLAKLRKASVFELFTIVRKVSIQRHANKHKVDTIVADRVVAVVYQVAVYYAVLFLVEPILERAYYSPALGASTLQWCPTLTSPDVGGWLQILYDCIS